MPAVSNTSPLILYAKIGRLELLRELFENIAVPHAVLKEILAHASQHPEVESIVSASWITTHHVERHVISADRLDAGEAEAITLASTDQARSVVMRLDLKVVGSSGVLIAAKDRRLVPSVKEPLDELVRAGLYLDSVLYHHVLTIASEADDEE